MKPLFITATYIKTYGVIENNVDDKIITSTISMVQDMNLQPILGSSLYNEISSQIDNNNITSDNKILLDEYILNYLLHTVTSECVVAMNFRFANKGIVTQNSENQYPVSVKELELIQTKFQGKADFYAQRLSLFLEQNCTKYPLFNNYNTELQDIQSTKPKYHSGFYLGLPRRNRNY
jgi:hypothetical protein